MGAVERTLYAYLRSKFVSNHYSNPYTNPRTLNTLALTLTDPHDFKKYLYAIRGLNDRQHAK